MQTQKITDRIQKLLKLAGSPEPEEAASALAAAKMLMKKHQISEQDLNQVQQSDLVDEEVGRSRYADVWRRVLWSGVAQVEGCRSFWITSRAMGCIWYLIGTRGKVAHAKEMATYFLGQIEKETKNIQGIMKRRVTARKRFGRSFWVSFRLGMADCLRSRLIERKRREEAAAAMEKRIKDFDQAYFLGEEVAFFETDRNKPMVVKKEEDPGVEQFMEGENIKVKQAKEAEVSDVHGYALGYQRALAISLNRQVGG